MTRGIWDIGDPEPEDATAVNDYTFPYYDPSDWEDHEEPGWGRTLHNGWKGYKNGKVYMEWDELVRRYGPLTEK